MGSYVMFYHIYIFYNVYVRLNIYLFSINSFLCVWYMYVCAHVECMSAGAFLARHTCSGQKTTLGVSPHLLRSLFCNWLQLNLSVSFPGVSCLHFPSHNWSSETIDVQCCAQPLHGFWLRNSDLGPLFARLVLYPLTHLTRPLIVSFHVFWNVQFIITIYSHFTVG